MSEPLSEPLQRIYNALASVPNLAVDDAFVAALPRLNHAQRALAIEKLFERRHISGLASLVGGFAGYDDHLQAIVLERIDHLGEAVRGAMASPATDPRLGAIELVQSSNSYHLAYLLSEVLPRPCAVTKRAAASALKTMTQDLIEPSIAPSDTNAAESHQHNRRCMADALHRALHCWASHFRTEVLVAAMWLCELTESCLFEKASDIRTHISRGLNEMLRAEFRPEMAPYALRAMRHPSLRAVAAHEISRCSDSRFMKRFLNETWTTLDPKVAKACARLAKLDWLSQLSDADLRSLSEQHSRAIVRIISVSAMPPDQKIKQLKRMLVGGSPVQREVALWGVTQIDAQAAEKLLRGVAAWNLGDLSRIASHELFRRDPTPPGHYESRAAWTQPDVEDLTGETMLNAYWERYDILNEQQAAEEGRRLRSRYPRFGPWLRSRLVSADADDRLRALRIIRSLGPSVEGFEERIYAASHDSDDKVRSHAVALLAEVDGAAVVRILRQALNDPNSRVQANAIEVLDRVAASPNLAAKLESDSSRVRANAIKSMLPRCHRDAAVALIEMLKDESPSRRLSALWVVERLGLTSLSERVAKLAEHDPEDSVRSRARDVVSDLNTRPRVAADHSVRSLR